MDRATDCRLAPAVIAGPGSKQFRALLKGGPCNSIIAFDSQYAKLPIPIRSIRTSSRATTKRESSDPLPSVRCCARYSLRSPNQSHMPPVLTRIHLPILGVEFIPVRTKRWACETLLHGCGPMHQQTRQWPSQSPRCSSRMQPSVN